MKIKTILFKINMYKLAGRFKSIIFLILLISALTNIASAEDYYVAISGDNSDTGKSIDHAFATPFFAVSQLQAGDTLWVVDGIWHGSDAVMSFTRSGTAEDPIKILTYNGTPILDGNYAVSGIVRANTINWINITGPMRFTETTDQVIMLTTGNNWTLDNLEIDHNLATPGIEFRTNIDDCTFTNLYVHDVTWSAISLHNLHDIQGTTYSDRNEISNCIIERSTQHNGIDLHTDIRYTLVYNNTISDNNNEGIYVHGWSAYNEIYNNTCGPNNNRGISLDNGAHHNSIYNNTCFGNRNYGLQDSGSSRGPSHHNIFKNNLLYSNGYNAVMIHDSYDSIYENNQITDTKSGYYYYRFGNGDASNIIIRNTPIGLTTIDVAYSSITGMFEFTDGRVFSENSAKTPHWYPTGSKLSLGGSSEIITATSYNMTAVPTTDPLDIIINKFDTSLPNGNILIDFTATTTNGNNAVFTIGSLKPNYNYIVKRDGGLFTTKQADSSGYLQFSNNEWPTKTFTLEESDVISPTGNILGTVTDKISGVPIFGAIVTDGIVTNTTDSLGKFFLPNVIAGSRTITASKTDYQAMSKIISVVENSTVTAEFQLEPSIPPTLTSYSPINRTPSQDEGTTNTFNVTVDQPVTNKWYLNSIRQSETSHSFSKTWSYTDSGIHNITYSGENSNGSMSIKWDVTVIDFTDSVLPTITVTSPESREYTTNIIPLIYSANEPIMNCIIVVDSTANQSLPTCDNLAVISREYTPKSNTAAWWQFNENQGNSVQDTSENTNTGTINDAFWTIGKFGTALQFDGTTSFIEVPDSDILDGGSQITIEAWVKPVVGTRGSVVAKYTFDYVTPINERVYELDIGADGKVDFALSSNGTNPGTVWLSSSNAVSSNIWNHIVAVSDGTTMKLYINGIMDPNTKSAPSVIHSSPYNLQIGAWRYDDDGAISTYFNGEIDEVRILKKALTEQEVKADYALGAGLHNVSIYAMDVSANWNSTTRSFTVVNDGDINNAPILDPIGYQSVYGGQTLSFMVSATDPDSDPLTYSATNLPTGATFNPTNRTFSWTPDETQAGSYQVNFEVTDGSLTDSEDVTITVNDATPPVITGVNAASITDTSATGKWNTDEPSDSLVKYGTVSGVYTAEVYNAAGVVSHSIQLTGLSPDTTYYYVVNSTDPYGNSNESVEYDFTTVSQDSAPTSVTNPTAAPSIIPEDTDSDPRWGESSRLNVTVTDDDDIAGVTIDLSAIGGSSAQPMTNTGGNTWSVNTSAAAGTPPQTYDLGVNATDIHGHSNTSVVISLTVVKNGDINNDGNVDYMKDAVYLVRHTRNMPDYEAVLDGIADVTGDGMVDFDDAVYLVRHTRNTPGYEILH